MQYVEQSPGRSERLLAFFSSRLAQAPGPAGDTSTWPPAPPAALRHALQDVAFLRRLGDGRARFTATTHGLCEAP